MNTPTYSPRSAYADRDDQSDQLPRRGRPVQEPGDPRGTDLPRRGQRISESSVPPRRPPPDPADLPPRRPGSGAVRPAANTHDDLPPRRGQPVENKGDDKTTNVLPPRPRLEPATPPATLPPSVSTSDSGGEGKTPESTSTAVTFTSGSAAKEIEEILQMLEVHITELTLSATDLHTLASLIAILGKHVSRLAVEKEQAGARSAASAKADEAPEPED